MVRETTATVAGEYCTIDESGYWRCLGRGGDGQRQSGGVGSLPERVLPGVASPRGPFGPYGTRHPHSSG
eukprot:1724673-Pleurochrysis_carterae.AAC.3